MNTRIDIPRELVDVQIAKAVVICELTRLTRVAQAAENAERFAKDTEEGNGHFWARKPASIEKENELIDSWIIREKEHYSTVRVIELNKPAARRFILVYGDADDNTVDHGTGPFESFEKARDWFLNGGR